MPEKTIGAQIKQYMSSNGITQSFVSAKTEIPPNILSPILNSKRNLYAEEYFLICEALGVPLHTFKSNEKQAS